MTGSNRPPAGHSPGWYPDPWLAGRQQRYWDGNRWTPMTAPARVVAAAPVAGGRRRRFGRFLSLSLATFVLGVLVVLYAMMRGQDVKRVSPTGDIEFYSSGGGTEFSSEEIEQRQQSMGQRLTELEQTARQSAASSPQASGPTLSGTWFGDNGLRYDIQQFGMEAVIQEITVYGVTAIGYGEVNEAGVAFAFQAVDGSSGIADLELVGDGRLEGSFDNDTFGTSVPAVLTR